MRPSRGQPGSRYPQCFNDTHSVERDETGVEAVIAEDLRGFNDTHSVERDETQWQVDDPTPNARFNDTHSVERDETPT